MASALGAVLYQQAGQNHKGRLILIQPYPVLLFFWAP